MENGERITFGEYDRRTEIKLGQKESLWQKKLQDPKILKLLNRAKEVLERRLQTATTELNQLIEDDDVLGPVWEMGRSKTFEGLHHLIREDGGCPFNVYPYHHRGLREKLEKRKKEYESSLQNLGKLLSGKFGKPYKAKPAHFESPL